MLELKIKQGRKHVPIFDLPAYLGRDDARREIGDTVEGLIAFLDELGGDPDLEDGGDDELTGDEMGDPAYAEWHTLRGPEKKRGSLLASTHEDDEDDDPGEEDDDSGQCDEDGINTGHGGLTWQGPGCEISDPGGDADGGAMPSYGMDQSKPHPWAPVNDLRARKPHRDRIRLTRCNKGLRIVQGIRLVEYDLKSLPFGTPVNSN
jgi:hypothetical protein